MSRSKDQDKGKSGVSPDEDAALFRRAMADARPLTLDTVEPPRRRVRPAARFSRRDEREALRESLQADVDASESASGEALLYRHPSVHLRTMRRLARGDYSVQGEIDLHGLTAAEAKEQLSKFIESSLYRGDCCVRVIHGKGLRSGQQGPVLKRNVDRWLRRWDAVLAFASARQAQGGTGALHVLLRKPGRRSGTSS